MVDVDVLIVGGGAAGLAASMMLSQRGVRTHLVSKYPSTSRLPKAHIISIKTMEIFRELGIESAIRAAATPPEKMRVAGYYAGFAGPTAEYGRTIARIGAWGQGGLDPDWLAVSGVMGANLMQSQLEPLMKARAEALARGSVRFNHQLIEFDADPDGVVATVEDRASGEHYQARARYLLACDGGRVIGPKLGIEMQGKLAVATSISIHFSADLSRWYHDEEALTGIILNPDLGVPFVLIPMGPNPWGRHSKEWLVHLMSFAGDHKLMDDDAAVAFMLQGLGLPDLAPEIHVINRWPLDAVVASRFRVGRTFMLGDAAHRNPPAGGHGLNFAVQDAYNLAWKLAAVIEGKAGDALLDSYEAERRPVARQIVDIAFAGWQKNGDIAKAIGFLPQLSAEQKWANIRRLWQDDEAGEGARRDLARVLPGILPNYNSLTVGFGYSYGAGALTPEGQAGEKLDPLGVFEPSTRPGHSLPHAWIEHLLGRTAIGDLVGHGAFVLIAGEAGRAWCDAARLVAAERAIALQAFTIGTTEGDWLDMRHSWRKVREHGPTGAILVRPDRFIAWRAQDLTSDPAATLRSVFEILLRSHPPSPASGAQVPQLAAV